MGISGRLSQNLDFLFQYESFEKKCIIEKNKEKVKGTILIDDRIDCARGREYAASWKHLLFSQPYNQSNQTLPRLNSWIDWEEMIDSMIKKK